MFTILINVMLSRIHTQRMCPTKQLIKAEKYQFFEKIGYGEPLVMMKFLRRFIVAGFDCNWIMAGCS